LEPRAAEPVDGAAGPGNLRVVRYPELTEAVRAQRGKVLVVDVWGEF